MRDMGSIPGLGRSPGEGKGYPLQYSGLENSMDHVVHGVTKSGTQLSDFHFTTSLGQRPQGRKYVHLKGIVPAWAWPSGCLSISLREGPICDRSVTATEQKWSPTSHHAQARVTSTPATTHTKMIWTSIHWEKTRLASTSYLVLIPETRCACFLHRNAPILKKRKPIQDHNRLLSYLDS